MITLRILKSALFIGNADFSKLLSERSLILVLQINRDKFRRNTMRHVLSFVE